MLSSLQKEYCKKKKKIYFKATSHILGTQPSFHVSKENMEKMFYGNNKVLQTFKKKERKKERNRRYQGAKAPSFQ